MRLLKKRYFTFSALAAENTTTKSIKHRSVRAMLYAQSRGLAEKELMRLKAAE
jgi:hypothetical protein